MSHLTPREEEVRHLLAQRLTNQEISHVLGIGVRTVEHHVAQIMAKLGVANRRQLAPVVMAEPAICHVPAPSADVAQWECCPHCGQHVSRS